jgi:hypothetical protein
MPWVSRPAHTRRTRVVKALRRWAFDNSADLSAAAIGGLVILLAAALALLAVNI